MTRHKLLHSVEKATADKRTPNLDAQLHSVIDEASHEQIVAVADELAAVMQQLNGDGRQLLEMQLADRSIDEMAAALGKSRRTVRRMLLTLRRLFERRLELTGPSPDHPPAAPFEMVATLDYRDFTIERLVGAGGFGKVYRANRRTTGDDVAMKVLRKKLLIDRRAVSQFVAEARIISTLTNPGIIRLHGLGQTPGGGYFLVLDWHARGDLASLNDLSVAQAVDYVAQAAEVIAHAHKNGVVHCDLKPSNLLLTTDDRVVVTDFGFAVALTRAAEESENAVGGTAGFTAPELFAGASPSPGCDVFSLGQILRHLLNRAATDVDSAQQFEPIIKSATDPYPARRLSTAAEFARQLRRLSEALPLT
jgi:serine/threonine protein kinase